MGNVTIINSTISNNGQIAHGASLEINGSSKVYIENSTLHNNIFCGVFISSNQTDVVEV